MVGTPVALSAAAARRVALAAQGFGRPRPTGRIDRRQGRAVVERLGCVQIDSVNVVVRSQELPLLARLGAHPRDLVPRLTAAGDVFEYWGHEASHLPVDLHPLLRWRMDDARRGVGTWGRVARIVGDRPGLVDRVLAQVVERPLTVGMLEGGGERGEGMWAWSPGKVALEYLFWSGRITARRGPNFERWYDLVERALPPHVLDAPTPSPEAARAELLVRATAAHGVGTVADLADYYRLKVPESRRLLDALVTEGRLLPAEVEGWDRPAYLHPDARRPRRITGRALLSPFDSLVWARPRVERLWGFRYRIEIYVPAARRVHGYYVLPFLLDEDLVGRVDLKSDRQAGVLRVRAAFGEPGIDLGRVATELAAELAILSGFLGLTEGVVVEGRGDLAPSLTEAVAAGG
jgi:uncharacterized protein